MKVARWTFSKLAAWSIEDTERAISDSKIIDIIRWWVAWRCRCSLNGCFPIIGEDVKGMRSCIAGNICGKTIIEALLISILRYVTEIIFLIIALVFFVCSREETTHSPVFILREIIMSSGSKYLVRCVGVEFGARRVEIVRITLVECQINSLIYFFGSLAHVRDTF